MSTTTVFTAQNAWRGGFYELFIASSHDQLCTLLKAIWSFPRLDGCYLQRECEPTSQQRVVPCTNGIAGHLYGQAVLPNNAVVTCGSIVMDLEGEEELPPAHSVSFYLPLGALSGAYPVGACPFGSMDRVSEWKDPVDSFLVELARWVHSRAPFDFGLVGFELDPPEMSAEEIRAGSIPDERSAGILRSDGNELKWYPATRP